MKRMFLKKLYCYNKALFLFFLFFLLSFLFINYKWGMVASPVYLYGMFSEPVHLSDTQNTYVISVNDKKLMMSNYSFAKKDMMLVMPAKYINAKEQNLLIYQLMSRIFSKVGLAGLHHPVKYINRLDDAGFMKWYMNYLSHILSQPVNKVEISSQAYIWKNNKIQAVGSLQNVPLISAK